MSAYHRYSIEEAVCDECEEIYHNTVLKEWEKEHPDCRDEKGTIKREYFREWDDVYKGCPKRICFIFEADCHGDAISLCSEHLKNALEAIKVKETESRE